MTIKMTEMIVSIGLQRGLDVSFMAANGGYHSRNGLEISEPIASKENRSYIHLK